MTLIIIALFFVYLIFVGLLIIGWHKSVTSHVLDDRAEDPLLSIIIPVRNEQTGIAHLLEDIRIQSYQNFEVIVVNDNSSDNTAVDRFNFYFSRPKVYITCQSGRRKKGGANDGD